MKKIFSSSRKHFNTLIAVFLLAFASVFTFFFAYEGWSFAADGTVPQKFEIKWTSPTDGEYLTYDNTGMAILKPSEQDASENNGFRGSRIKMNVGFIAGGADVHPAESITIKIPKYIVKDRYDEYQGMWNVGLSKNKTGSTGFYYDDTSDPEYLIIKNFEEVATTREISFDITYTILKYYRYFGYGYSIFGLVDESIHNIAGIVEFNNILEYSNTLRAQIDTRTGLYAFAKYSESGGTSTKKLPEVYYEWDSQFGESPDNADDYIYVVWSILYEMRDVTQLSDIIITDRPENNGEMLGFLRPSSSTEFCTALKPGAYGINSETGNRYNIGCEADDTSYRVHNTTGNTQGIKVLTRYPKSELNQNTDTRLYNNAAITVDGIDNTHIERESRAYVIVEPDKFNPGGTTTSEFKKSCSEVKNRQLDYIENDREMLIECESWVNQLGYPLTLRTGGDPNNQDDYGQRSYKMELVDDLVALDGQLLTNQDYNIDYIKMRVASFNDYIHTTKGWQLKGYNPDPPIIDVDVYIKSNNIWSKFGVIHRNLNIGSGSGDSLTTISGEELYPEEVSCDLSASSGYCDSFIRLPDNVSGVKIVFDSNHYRSWLGFRTLMSLKPTDHVREIISGKDRIDFTNIVTYRLFDADGRWINNNNRYDSTNTEINNLMRLRDEEEYTDYDVRTAHHVLDNENLSRITRDTMPGKRLRNKQNQTDKSRIKLQYDAFVYATDGDFDISNDSGAYDDWGYGTFYDLLPLGMSVDASSIRCDEARYSTILGDFSSTVKDEMMCQVKILNNWRNSGRDMLVVTVKHSEDYQDIPIRDNSWRISYDAYYSYESIADYGISIVNSVAFQNNGSINSTSNGGASVVPNDGSRCVYNPERNYTKVCTDQELLTGLGDNPEQDTLYAEVTTIINDPINAELSSTKKVMAAKDVNYTMETETEQDEIYKYRLRTATAEGSSASNIIVYDVLEDAEPENKNRWEGFFDSVDVTQPKLKGADPVVYYSTKKDIKLCEQTSICPDNDLDNGLVWTNRLDDIADKKDVTAIAVDMRKKTDGTNFSIGEKEAVSVIVNMRAPKGGIVKQYMDSDAVALNESWFSNTLSQNDGSNVSGMTKSQITRVHIKAPDLDINKTSDPETGTAEDRTDLINNTTLDYTIKVTNNDETEYTNVEIEDTIPEGLTILPEQIHLASSESIPAESTSEAETANIVYRKEANKLIFTVKNFEAQGSYNIVVPTTLPKYVNIDKTYDNTAQINSIDGEEYVVESNTTYHEKKAPTLTTNIAVAPCQESCPARKADENGLIIPSNELNDQTVIDFNQLTNLPVGNYKLKTKLMQIKKDYKAIPDTLAATTSANFQVVSQDGENKFIQDGYTADSIATVFSNFDFAPRSVYVAYSYLYDLENDTETLVKSYENKNDKLETIITGNTAHNLALKKATTGSGIKASDEFDFTLNFTGLTKNKTYATSKSGVNVVADGEGKATLTTKLKGGEEIIVENLDTLSH